MPTRRSAIADRAYILVDGKNSRTGAASALAADPEIRRLFLGADIGLVFSKAKFSRSAGGSP